MHLVLFALTCLTTTWVGIISAHPELAWFSPAPLLYHISDGLPYAASIMGILLAHEMGHFVMARWHGVPGEPAVLHPPPATAGRHPRSGDQAWRVGSANATRWPTSARRARSPG